MQHAFTFPQCVYTSTRVLCFLQFCNFTILQSDTITHDYLRPAIKCPSLLRNHFSFNFISHMVQQWFVSAALLGFAGSDPNAEASELGGKNGSLAVYQKIS